MTVQVISHPGSFEILKHSTTLHCALGPHHNTILHSGKAIYLTGNYIPLVLAVVVGFFGLVVALADQSP